MFGEEDKVCGVQQFSYTYFSRATHLLLSGDYVTELLGFTVCKVLGHQCSSWVGLNYCDINSTLDL